MITSNGAVTYVEGLVESTNERGIRVKGEWLNRSQYGEPLELPTKGAYVRVQVDARGYLKNLEVVEPHHATADPAAAYLANPRRAADRQRIKLEVLTAAADFMGQLGQAREQIKVDHVLAVADRWLEWVERH